MIQRTLAIVLSFVVFFFSLTTSAYAARVPVPELGTLTCYSAGQELYHGVTVGEPNADEYFRALEFRIQETAGEPLRQINVSGGLCTHERGPVPAPKVVEVTSNLTCYSGGAPVFGYAVIGRESSDEYKGGRRFIAQQGDRFTAVTVYGNEGLCIGDEGLLR
jgi:hypothetical protein